MIAQLTGALSWQDTYCIVECGGVGYAVFMNARTWRTFGTEGTVYIHTHIKEEEFSLYEFSSLEDKKLFLMLMQTQGVGPKTALAITEAEPRDILGAIKNGDVSFFTAFPRVGKKVAQKIIIELRGKLEKGSMLDLAPMDPKKQEAFDALIALGFEEGAVRQSLSLTEAENQTTQELIKSTMKALSSRKVA